MRRRAGALLGALVVARMSIGCSSRAEASDAGDAASCSVGLLGDGGAPKFDFLVLRADHTVAPLNDGDQVPMLLPPQGGRVIFVGVRATNVDGCALQLTGALRDEASQQVRVDSRTVDLVPAGDGWGVSGAASEAVSAAIFNFANVPVCPNEWSTTSVYASTYALEVTIEDRRGRRLTNKIHVMPTCGEPTSLGQCLCICRAGYVLGEACADADAALGDGDAGGGE